MHALCPDPVFIFSLHRSGSTLLSRILNCHPDLVIWGEHGGIINRFAELDATVARFPPLGTPLEERGLDLHAQFPNVVDFHPWISPVSAEGIRSWIRDYLISTFSTGLRADQRWGVKEIRYGGEGITRFLIALFPRAQFVIVRRDLTALCLSNILAPWSLDALALMGTFDTSPEADAVVADCAYALAVADLRLAQAATVAADQVITAQTERIAGSVPAIFDFLHLDLTAETASRVQTALASRAGSTDASARLGLLDRSFIADRAPEHIARAQQDIAQNGLDLARLHGGGRNAGGPSGRYCFVVGDHAMRESPMSSMGWPV